MPSMSESPAAEPVVPEAEMEIRQLLGSMVDSAVDSAVAAAAPDSVVTINEVQYHPADGEGGEPGVEWIELHKQMSIEMDLGGWSLRGGVGFDI